MLAGRSVLEWQAGLAREIGCERIICISETPSGAVIDLQRKIEAEGAEFHKVRSSIQLAALLRADDELVIVLDGLVPDANAARDLTQEGKGKPLTKGVWTISAQHVLVEQFPEDFERIDAERCWAGLSVMRAAPAQKLAEMPHDCDAVSLLLRLALQAHTPTRDLPSDRLGSWGWILAASGDVLDEREKSLVVQLAPSQHWLGLSRSLATLLVRQIAPKALVAGPIASLSVGFLLIAVGVILATLGHGAVALALGAVGAFGVTLGEVWTEFANRLLSRPGRHNFIRNVRCLQDILVTGVLVAIGIAEAQALALLAMPLIAIGLLSHVIATSHGAAKAFWFDRTLQTAILALAAAGGVLPEAIAGFCLAAVLPLGLARRSI